MKVLHMNDLQEREDILACLEEFSGKEDLHVFIEFPSHFSSAKVLRELVEEVCKCRSLPRMWCTRLILIADELNNNSIEYGSKEGDTNSLEFRVIHTEKGFNVSLEVSDAGTGEQTKTASQMEQMRRERVGKDFTQHKSIRGRGLFLIITDLVDHLGFSDNDSGGLTVSTQKLIAYPAE